MKMYPLKNTQMTQPKKIRYYMTSISITRFTKKTHKIIDLTMTINYKLLRAS